MSYLSPELLWLAMMLPLQVAGYVWLMRRRKRVSVQLSSLTLVKAAVGSTAGWRRHLPAALLFIACAAMFVAAARPVAPVTLPTEHQTIILAVDVSGSMEAADVAPNRITACQRAAKSFVEALPSNVRLGVVAYADSAQLLQPPTLRRDDVLAAIDRLQLQGGTAIGEGIATSLAALFPGQGDAIADAVAGDAPDGVPLDRVRKAAATPQFVPVAPGSDRSAIIVLLTDGQNTVGPEPMKAAQVAADRGIKVYTVGYGTKEGELTGAGGFSVRVRLDEETLKQVAELTRGEYFHAPDGAALARVYQGLQGRLVMERKDTELTALFAAAAALLLVIGGGLSIAWFGRVA